MTIISVKIIDRVAGALGYTPLVRELAAESPVSPWALTNSMSSFTLSEVFGFAETVAPTRGLAMTVATIAAGRNAIAGTSGRLPLVARQGGTRLETQPSLFRQFERGIPRATTLTWTYDSLMFYPHAWWHVLERDFYGWPTWIERVPQGRAKFDSSGWLIGIDDRECKPENVIRFDSPLGEGLLVNGRKTIQRAIAIEVAAAFAEDNPVPTVELHNEGADIEPDEIEALLESWSVARRKRGVGYTPRTLKVIPHGQQTGQLLIEGRRALSLDAVRAMSLPAWAASTAVEGATMTYDNRQLRNWELLDLTLADYHTAVAGRLSLNDVTPNGSDVIVDTDELTRPDQKTRFETYEIGKRAGFVDNAWIAAQEGWSTVPKEPTP